MTYCRRCGEKHVTDDEGWTGHTCTVPSTDLEELLGNFTYNLRDISDNDIRIVQEHLHDIGHGNMAERLERVRELLRSNAGLIDMVATKEFYSDVEMPKKGAKNDSGS